MLHNEISTTNRLHEAISFEAQRLVDGNDPIDSIHADIVELVDEYRGHLPDRAKDRHAETDWQAYFSRTTRGISGGSVLDHIVKMPSEWPGMATIDLNTERLKRLRIVRETALAAMSRVIGDVIIQKVLGYSSDDGIDMHRMMASHHLRSTTMRHGEFSR